MWVPLPGKSELVHSLLASSLAPPTAPPTSPAQPGAPAAAGAAPRPEYSRYTLPETAHGDSGESKKWREVQTAAARGYLKNIFCVAKI